MPDPTSSLGGKSIQREVIRHRYRDSANGEEFTLDEQTEVVQGIDGSLETTSVVEHEVLGCGHAVRPGDRRIRCQSCGASICSDCSIVCPVTGEATCLRCSQLGPDRQRYSRTGLKQARRLGFFNDTADAPPSSQPPCLPFRPLGFLRKILEWW